MVELTIINLPKHVHLFRLLVPYTKSTRGTLDSLLSLREDLSQTMRNKSPSSSRRQNVDLQDLESTSHPWAQIEDYHSNKGGALFQTSKKFIPINPWTKPQRRAIAWEHQRF